MKVTIYLQAPKSIELWSGTLTQLPSTDELIALPGDESFRVIRRVFRLDLEPNEVQIYVR